MAAEELAQIRMHIQNIGNMTSSFRQAASQHSETMSRILKDVHNVISTQRRDITSFSENVSNAINDIRVQGNRTQATTMNYFNQTLQVQQSMLNEMRTQTFILRTLHRDMSGGMMGGLGSMAAGAVGKGTSGKATAGLIQGLLGTLGGGLIGPAGTALMLMSGKEMGPTTAAGGAGQGGGGQDASRNQTNAAPDASKNFEAPATSTERYGFNRISGDPRSPENLQNLTQVNTPYGRITVRKDAAAAYDGFYKELHDNEFPMDNPPGSFNIRQKKSAGAGHNPGSGWSQHSYGNATDIGDQTQWTKAQKDWFKQHPGMFEEIKKKWGMASPQGDEPHMEFMGAVSPGAAQQVAKQKEQQQKAEQLAENKGGGGGGGTAPKPNEADNKADLPAEGGAPASGKMADATLSGSNGGQPDIIPKSERTGSFGFADEGDQGGYDAQMRGAQPIVNDLLRMAPGILRQFTGVNVPEIGQRLSSAQRRDNERRARALQENAMQTIAEDTNFRRMAASPRTIQQQMMQSQPYGPERTHVGTPEHVREYFNNNPTGWLEALAGSFSEFQNIRMK